MLANANKTFNFENMNFDQLQQRRREILEANRAANPEASEAELADKMTDEMLAEIVQIHATLARRSSGPPKKAKAVKGAPVTVDDIA